MLVDGANSRIVDADFDFTDPDCNPDKDEDWNDASLVHCSPRSVQYLHEAPNRTASHLRLRVLIGGKISHLSDNNEVF